MQREERGRLRSISDEVNQWVTHGQTWLNHRARVAQAGDQVVAAVRATAVKVNLGGRTWRLTPLRVGDSDLLGRIAAQTQLPQLPPDTEQMLQRLTTETAAAVRDAKAALGLRRIFVSSTKRDTGEVAALHLVAYRDWAVSTGVPTLLDGLSRSTQTAAPQVSAADALADWVGLRPRLLGPNDRADLVPVGALGNLPAALRVIDAALSREAQFRKDASAAGEKVRRVGVWQILSEMPVERLKDATRDRLRVGPLTDAGIRTVQGVIDRSAQLETLPGIGATTAARMRGAANALWQVTRDEMPVRIDIKKRTPETTELLRRLQAWDTIREAKGATTDLALKDALAPLAARLALDVSHLLVVSPSRPVSDLLEAVAAIHRRARQLHATSGADGSPEPWDDFLRRPADFFAMLTELGLLTEDETKTHGDLPDEIVRAVRDLELNTQYLVASLRGYQSFGARFALVQRKVIIGDEMGLGKTVEALAVLAHLRSKGSHHSLVICPAAVVTNWMREVRAKSRLDPYRVHGPSREAEARSWIRNGGVAVTTYETLPWFEPHLQAIQDLGCVVVDEAHYIKNPDAQRSKRARRVIRRAERAVLLTGTPLENRIDEFRNLVSYVRPDLALDDSDLAPRRFRRQVAPAYLRRNQEDVLTELPELVEVEEWLPLSPHDDAAYRAAVSEGNFMTMRQAAMLAGLQSEKIQRLLEIVEEARDNGRRVLVFSHFRAVLDMVARILPGQVYGPLTGSVPASARQDMVDQFAAAHHGAVLVSQIIAGGQGLNIQAASVVVICEPQLKPTTEWQAIARAHRMGQLDSVQVHRLLSESGVDERITEILARKKGLFEEFARVSETAASAPEALDVSEAELARQVVAAERERLFTSSR